MGKTPNTFISQNTPFALIIGGCFVIASYMCFRHNGNIYANLTLDRTITFLYIIGLFMQIRRYRESRELQGYISYGKALKTGTYIAAIVGVIYGIYIFFLYTLYPELLKNYLTTVEAAFRELYPDSPLAENMIQMLHAFTTPVSMGFSEFFSKILMGFIYTLIIAAFLKKRRSVDSRFHE